MCLRAQEKCRATKELITDLELMANADYFVGSSTSGVPGIVATLRLVVYKKSQVRLHICLDASNPLTPSIPDSIFWNVALVLFSAPASYWNLCSRCPINHSEVRTLPT